MPSLGLCLGLQCMVMEFARNVLGLEGASSSEFDPDTDHPVIATMEEQQAIVEGKGDIFRFHHGLAPDVVEYVLVHEEIRFLGQQQASQPAPWPAARFKKRAGKWVPLQKTPVRYSASASYSSVADFARLCLGRLLAVRKVHQGDPAVLLGQRRGDGRIQPAAG